MCNSMHIMSKRALVGAAARSVLAQMPVQHGFAAIIGASHFERLWLLSVTFPERRDLLRSLVS